MVDEILYEVWGFSTARLRDTLDKTAGKYLGPVRSFKQVLDIQIGGGFLAYWDPKADKWVPYGEMAASYNQEPWVSMKKRS